MLTVSDQPLNDDEIDWLETFLLDRIDDETDTRDLDEGVFCISELDGLLTAVVSGPVMLPPSKWLPQVWGDFEPEFESEEMFGRVFSLMTRHLNNIAALLMNQPHDYEPMFLERELKGEIYTIVDEWCEGFMRGINLARMQWNLESSDMKVLVAPIAAFHGELGFATHDRFNKGEIEKLQNAITPNVREIHAYWLAKRARPAPIVPIRHAGPRVGRNDACPCGSGKKFKKCCLH